jgi:hypothetical protein
LPLLFPSFHLPSKVLEELIIAKLQGPWCLEGRKVDGRQGGYGPIYKNEKGLEYPSIVVCDFLMQNPAGQPLGNIDPHWIYGFKIDASQEPARIEITTIINMMPNKDFGIIRFKNDRLEICVKRWSKLKDPGNPTREFLSTKNSRTTLYTYRRPNWYAVIQRMGIEFPHFWNL